MVYGKDCKGNFPKLVRLVRMLPVFPEYPNRRAMIHIDNLCVFLDNLVRAGSSGTFFPQNAAPVCTSDAARHIAQALGKNLRTTTAFNGLIQRGMCVGVVNKLFGDFVYEGPDSVPMAHILLEESVQKSV